MKLFEENSYQDLVCRGFSREYILGKTGKDVGYHASSVKAELIGVDRFLYKVKHVRQRCPLSFVFNAHDLYADGVSAVDILSYLGLANPNVCKLKMLFCELGYSFEFEVAHSISIRKHMSQGMIQKFGTDNPFNLREFQDKAKRTKLDKYGRKQTFVTKQ